MRNPLLFRVDDSRLAPWWAGLVFIDHSSRVKVCSVLPLSTAMRIGWLVYQWLRFPFRASLVEERRRRIECIESSISYLESRQREAPGIGGDDAEKGGGH